MKVIKKDIIALVVAGFLSGIFALPLIKNIGLLNENLKIHALIVLGAMIAAGIGFGFFVYLSKWKSIFYQIGKYSVVGALNTFIDFGILNALSYATQVYSGYWIAFYNVVGFVVANTNSYFWNRFWTFDRTDKSRTLEFGQFFAISLIAMGANTMLVYLGTTYIHPLGELGLPQWENIMKLCASAVSLVINFIGYKYFVFKK